MQSLTSKFKHTVDVKGRMTMPSKFRASLGEVCYVTRGLDGCLAVYSDVGFEEYTNKILATKKHSKEARMVKRQLFSNVDQLTYDKQGRILLSAEFRELAAIEKEVLVMGIGDHIEIWDRARYEKLSYMDDETYSDTIEDLLNDMNSFEE